MTSKHQPDPELAGRVVALLNELLELDRPAVAALTTIRVPCNGRLADHPAVQVVAQHWGFHVGMLGLLNGLCGVRDDGWGLIGAVFATAEDASAGTGESVRAGDLLRFEVLAKK